MPLWFEGEVFQGAPEKRAPARVCHSLSYELPHLAMMCPSALPMGADIVEVQRKDLALTRPFCVIRNKVIRESRQGMARSRAAGK